MKKSAVPWKSVVPWRTPDQFRKVYEYSYSEDISKKRWAVEQMAVWETRCWPALPFAVEATLLLVRSKIQDMLFEADKSFCQAREVEMMYCTAVVRFVNLMLETYQNTKGRVRLADLAEKKNIPPWIIDTRHNISHGHCPTLPVLRMAYKTIMEYLDVKFWTPETNRVSFMKKKLDDKPMSELLHEYRSIQHERGYNMFARDRTYTKALKNVCKKIEQVVSKPDSRRHFLQFLVHPDNFVRKGDIALAVNDDREFVNDVGDHVILPTALQNFWNPLLVILHKYNSIPEFIEMLLLSQENRTITIFQKVVDYTVLYILELTKPSAATSEIGSLFLKKPLVLDLHRLLYSCMIGASTYSNVVFEKLTEQINLGNWKEELTAMLSIKRGLTIPKDTEKDAKKANKGQKRKFDITFTVGDLEEDIHSELRNRNPKFNENHWSNAPIGIDFSKVPLGHVFNPVEKERKEESKQEIMEIQPHEPEQIHPMVTESSKPIEMPKPMNFIFERTPAHTSMIYRRRGKKSVF